MSASSRSPSALFTSAGPIVANRRIASWRRPVSDSVRARASVTSLAFGTGTGTGAAVGATAARRLATDPKSSTAPANQAAAVTARSAATPASTVERSRQSERAGAVDAGGTSSKTSAAGSETPGAGSRRSSRPRYANATSGGAPRSTAAVRRRRASVTAPPSNAAVPRSGETALHSLADVRRGHCARDRYRRTRADARAEKKNACPRVDRALVTASNMMVDSGQQ